MGLCRCGALLALLLCSLATTLPAAGRATDGAEARCRVNDGPPLPCVKEAAGGLWSIALPEGMTLVFAIDTPDLGVAWIERGDAALYADPEGADYQNARPWELGEFRPEAERPGCWTASRGADRYGIDHFCLPVKE